MADEWTTTVPANALAIADIPSNFRGNKTNIIAVLEKEHADLDDSNVGGEHLQGSAVIWHLATASIPALQPDGTALASTDNGRMWHDITTDIVYVLDDYATPTTAVGWVPIGHYLGDIAINTNKFTVARATGNTAIAGTLGVTGVATLPSAVLNTALSGTAVLDEDNMASDSATKIATQQSIKAYIAAQIAAAVTLSAYTDEDSDSTAMAKSHAYKAATDGWFWAHLGTPATGDTLLGYVGTDNDPEGNGTLIQSAETNSTGDKISIGAIAVAKGEYFEVISSAGPTILWKSMGTLSKPADQEA